MSKRTLDFLDGTSWIVGEDDCRGCLMNERSSQLSKYLKPVYEDEYVVVRQDAEFCVPAFYIVSPIEHIDSLMNMSNDLIFRLFLVTKFVRLGMKKVLNINVANIYHEERLKNSHYHHWILPFWDKEVRECGFIPKIYQSNVKKYQTYDANVVAYLKYFTFDKYCADILSCNKRMMKFLKSSVDLN